MGAETSRESRTDKYDFFIQWHVTERCNLRCSHCYQDGTVNNELTFKEIQGVISEVSEMLDIWSDSYNIELSRSVNLTGGEPFLRPDIFQIIEEIKNFDFDIYLLSNGTLIDNNKAALMSDIGINGVQVSIEGPEIIHDNIRGRGSFERAINGIKSLRSMGIEVTLNVTLSSLNYSYVMDVIPLAVKLGVQRLGFSRLVPSGRGRKHLTDMLDKESVKQLYDRLLNVEIEGLDIVTGDPVASQINKDMCENAGATALGGCAAGISGLTFRPDGAITPCRRLNIPVGNLREDSLREVWAGSEVLCQLRDKSSYSGKCRYCNRWAFCRGCRAIAYEYSKSKGGDDYLAEDPQCFINDCKEV